MLSKDLDENLAYKNPLFLLPFVHVSMETSGRPALSKLRYGLISGKVNAPDKKIMYISYFLIIVF